MVMFLTGGIVYFYFEIFVRGYSHLSMLLLGGVCFYCVGRCGSCVLMMKKTLWFRILMIMFISAVIITSLEFITGLIVNVSLNLYVWDYSRQKYNFMGQICLIYSMLWSLMGLPCVYFYGLIDRFVLEKGQKNSQA